MKEFSDWIAGIAAIILIAVAYTTIGFVMSLPYVFLAGGGTPDHVSFGVMCLPIATFVAYALYQGCKSPEKDIPWYMHRILFGFVGYVLLPIIANGIAQILGALELGGASDVVFAYRYTTLWIAPLACVSVLLARSAMRSHESALQSIHI